MVEGESGPDPAVCIAISPLRRADSRRNVIAARNGENGNAKFDDAIDDFRAIAARGAASVVLWLTDQLPKIIDLPDETVE